MVTEQSLGVSTAQQLSGTNFQDNNFLLAGVRISFQTSQNWRREEKRRLVPIIPVGLVLLVISITIRPGMLINVEFQLRFSILSPVGLSSYNFL